MINQSLIFKKQLIGALTSKPYAFMARSWELKIYESVDIFDNFGSSIRIDLRNFKVLRILPKFNYLLNEGWITDKVRFCYDGLNKQRLNLPLVRINKQLISVNWQKLFIKMKTVLKQGYQMDSFCGDLVDFETLFVFKKFLNNLGVSNFNFKNFTSFTNLNLRNSYICELEINLLKKLNNLIFLYLNLRLENPILNIKIRKQVVKFGLKIFNIGFCYNLTYIIFNLGNNIFSFLKFIEGQHLYCQKFMNEKLNYFLLGSNIYYKNDCNFFIQNLKLLKLWFNFNYGFFITGSNILSMAEIGATLPSVLNLNTIFQNKILYLMDMDDLNFKNHYYDFVIYQGHHGDLNVYKADVVLPSYVPYEKKSLYINLYGFVQKIERIIMPINFTYVKHDWEIIKGLGDFLDLELPYEDFVELHSAINRFIGNSLLNISNFNELLFLGSLGLNSPILNYMGNYYLTNSITRASLVMTLCAFRFKLTNFN